MFNRTRVEYWSDTKFASWIRKTFGGYEKPIGASLEEWNTWKSKASTEHPIVYWITEELLDNIQDFVMFPADVWNSVRYYIRNRFFDRVHVLDTKFPRGQFVEYDTRVLHAVFESFVDFIECEKAWMTVVFDKSKYNKYGYPFWTRWWTFRFYTFRCPQAGVDHLKWEMSLVWNEEHGIEPGDDLYNKPMDQAVSAKEQYELYNWWKNVRPQRPNVWSDEFDGDPFMEEQRQYDEDTEMLIRLIKIRQGLWT